MHRASALLVLASACGGGAAAPAPDATTRDCTFRTAADDVAAPAIHTPRWAFRPWISKDISDDADTRAFVAGFRERDIPVGVVVLDSPWETNYNTFVPNPERYPAFEDLVADLHADDVRIVLWTTQMMNSASLDLEPDGDTYPEAAPPFAEGKACGFYVNRGDEYLWWKGNGAAVDFFDEQAVGWWHRLQDPLLDLGIDGWKLDFGEDYIVEQPITTDAGAVTLQAYSEAYYADFYAYGAARRGTDDFVTMVRPWDESYGRPGRFYARPEHAPVAWVGDNRRDWVGLADALDHIFRSAAAGYVVVGSDIGGYLDRDDLELDTQIPFDSLVFARWTAVAAMTPFFQLHGRANLAPWTVPDSVDDTVEMYRYWATLHDQLVPFWYSLAEAGYATMPFTPIVRPVGDEAAWAGDYRFGVGDAFLVAPLLDAAGVRDVALPEGTWFDWWDVQRDPIAGGQTLADVSVDGRIRIPLYVREGAIVPLEVTNDVTGLGTAASADELTVLVYPAPVETSFDVIHEDGTTTAIRASRAGATITVTMTGAATATILRVRTDTPIAQIRRDDTPLLLAPTRDALFEATGDAWISDGKSTWVRLAPGATTTTTIVMIPPA